MPSKVHQDAAWLALASYVVEGPNDDGECTARCPRHDDANPSAAFNFKKRVWFCHASPDECGKYGWNLDDLAYREHLSNESSGEPFPELEAPHLAQRTRQPLPSPERVARWHERLLDGGMAIGYLLRERHLTEEVIKKYEIGWNDRTNAYTIPLRDRKGRLRNVRYYRRTADGKQMWSVKGRKARLFPVDVLIASDEILVVEGEWDALCAISHGIPAITGTGGASGWKPAWSKRFHGKRAVVAYDCDSAGRKNAQRVAAAIAEHASAGVVLDLDPNRSDGFDLTDWFREGNSVTGLRTLMREALPDRPLLEIRPIAEVAQSVDRAPPAQWLFRPVMTSDAYGVLAAEDKAGKSWAIADAAVSAATGTPWLDHFPVDGPGPVLLFAGEGGERKLIRRLRAICGPRGLDVDKLPIRVCFRVPSLGAADQLELVHRELTAYPAALVLLDPLYLAFGREAKSGDLFNMGSYLQALQRIALDARAGLLIAHHWNQTGKGTGPERMSGAGPSAWGRVLMSASVDQRRTEPGGKTVVSLTLEFSGDEVPGTAVRMIRRVWAENPDDLTSPLHYELQTWTLDAPERGVLRPAMRTVLAALKSADKPRTVSKVVAVLEAQAKAGEKLLHRRSVETALQDLKFAGLVTTNKDDNGVARWWRNDA